MGRRHLWRWLLYLGLAAAILAVAASRTSLNPRSLLPDMVEGTAWRPYVKRALVGWTVRAIEPAIPRPAREALERRTAESATLRTRLGWEPAHATRFALVHAIHLVSLVAFAAFLARFLAVALGWGPLAAALGGASGLALVPIHFGYQNFVYDFPGLALFTLGLVLLWERRWTTLYLLWPIGMLNKETFVLLVPVFLVREWGAMPRERLARHLALQAALTIAAAGVVAWIFRANPGPPVEWHLMRNLTLRPPLRQLVHDLVYWGFVVFAFLAWKRQRALSLAALAVMGVLFVTTLFLGFLGEYRDFYEAWPLLFALAAQTAAIGWERLRGPARR